LKDSTWCDSNELQVSPDEREKTLTNADPKAQILQGHQGHGNLIIIVKSPE
jgi:hypothetical protein